MNRFLKKIFLERILMKKVNGYFERPYLHGLTFEAIACWREHHGDRVDSILNDVKEISVFVTFMVR